MKNRNRPTFGSSQAFATNDLPKLIDRVQRGQSRARVAQAAGAALFHSMDLSQVQVVSRSSDGWGTLFHGDVEAVRDQPVLEIAGNSGSILIRIWKLAGEFQEALEPLVRCLATLIEFAPVSAPVPARGRRQRDDELTPASSPYEVEPRTLETAVEDIYGEAAQLAAGDLSVLIRGESGSGKEVLARFIHGRSPVSTRRFSALNCAALPSDLLEAELFGIERGVATGVDARPGKFELADGGTLFLDEIGDMHPASQAKILRVIQEEEVVRVGGHRSRPARARLIAATNRDIGDLMDRGDFRSDLYHRLAGWDVTLPPLRRRPLDIVNLAVFFLDRECHRYGRECHGFDTEAIEVLTRFEWPGNVRQLRSKIVQALLLLDGDRALGRAHFPTLSRGSRKEPDLDLAHHLQKVEKAAIEHSLRSREFDVEAAAHQLGVSRATLYRRIAHLDIRVGS